MASSAYVIIDGKSEFNAMEGYYGMFPHEMSTKPWYTYNFNYVHRIPQINFESLLDKMIDIKSAGGTTDNFIIVCHGLYEKDIGKGLAMPLTAGSKMKAAYELLDLLLERLNQKDPDLEEFQREYTHTNASMGLYEAHFPPGSVVRLVNKMRQLRQLRVRCVELRACNLGTNKEGLGRLGQCFGARFIVAPDKKMFYVYVNPVVVDAKSFATHLKYGLKAARVFENPSNPADKLAILVKPGEGTSRNVDVATTSTNLRWFVEKYLWKDNKYPPHFTKPPMFYMEGIDVGGAEKYVLPQEAAWNERMKEAGPLPGNMIGVK